MTALMTSPDTYDSLIQRARAGDRGAFETLIGTCRDRLVALISFRLGATLRRDVDPDDVLQEAYLRAFQSLHRFTARSEDSFFRWVSGIARNVILEHSRKCRPASPVNDEMGESTTASPMQTMRRRERLDRLQKALDQLTPDYRKVLRSVLVEKLPVTEVARRMDRSPNAVSLILLRANRKLRESFGDTQSLGLPAAELKWSDSDATQ